MLLQLISRSDLNLRFDRTISGSLSCGTDRTAGAFALVPVGYAAETPELRLHRHRLPRGEEI